MKYCTRINSDITRIIVLGCILCINACAIHPASSPGEAPTETVAVDSDVERAFQEAVKLLRDEKYDTAMVLLNSVIEKEKRLAAPYINLAMIYRKKGDEKQAEENLLKALEINPAQPVASNELGLIYRKQGRFDEARKVYVNALTKYPEFSPVIKNLGILCDLYMRDAVCALEQFERYQELVPEDESVKIWIADIKTRI